MRDPLFPKLNYSVRIACARRTWTPAKPGRIGRATTRQRGPILFVGHSDLCPPTPSRTRGEAPPSKAAPLRVLRAAPHRSLAQGDVDCNSPDYNVPDYRWITACGLFMQWRVS